MRYEIEFIEHNGVAGANRVEPFAGASLSIAAPFNTVEGLEPLEYQGRTFTFSHKVTLPDQINYCFREKVQGEPSDWAKAQA
jgi:hypothetical protein